MNENKLYVVLFQYSPNGRNDKGEFRACVADGKYFMSKDEACGFVREKFKKIFADERRKSIELDEDWGMRITEEDLSSMGYSWTDDFSSLSFEYESSDPRIRPEPKYSWTVTEISA